MTRWNSLCDSKVHTSLPWEFVPQQRRVVVGLGEPTREGMVVFFVVVEVERCFPVTVCNFNLVIVQYILHPEANN